MTDQSVENLGVFQGCAADEIEGWNKAISYTNSVISDIDASVNVARGNYREHPEINVEIVGQSTILYRIRVLPQYQLISKFNELIVFLMESETDVADVLASFSRKLVRFRVDAYCASNRTWSRICIRSLKSKKFPHPFDALATVCLALNDDINTVTKNPELDQWRQYIAANWEQNWLLSDGFQQIGYQELTETLGKLRS